MKKDGNHHHETILFKIWRFFTNLKIELLFDPVIPLLGIYIEMKILKTVIWNFHSSTIYNSQNMQTTKCLSIDE